MRLPSAPAPAPASLVPVSALPLYPRLLGRSFGELDEAVRALHFTTSERCARGRATLRRGAGLWSRLLGWVLRLPAEAPGPRVQQRLGLPLELRVSPRRGGETWERRFGEARFVTEQRAVRGGLLGERMGALELRARPTARGGALVLESAGAALRLGPLALPLPRALSPRLSGRLWSGEDGRLRLRVEARGPLGGLLMEYEAQLEE